MSIKIEMLRCFRAVVERGSLAEAAETLGRTPSAVSMMLKQFEDHIGAPLFETARKSRLTPLGQQINAEAVRELEHFDRTVTTIEGLSRAELGCVRLAVTPSLAQAVLPPILHRFVEAHPKVRVDMSDMDSAAVHEELRAERADIVRFRNGQPLAAVENHHAQHALAGPITGWRGTGMRWAGPIWRGRISSPTGCATRSMTTGLPPSSKARG